MSSPKFHKLAVLFIALLLAYSFLPAQVKLEKVKPKLEAFLARFNEFFQKDVEAFKKALLESGLTPFGPFMPLNIK